MTDSLRDISDLSYRSNLNLVMDSLKRDDDRQHLRSLVVKYIDVFPMMTTILGLYEEGHKQLTDVGKRLKTAEPPEALHILRVIEGFSRVQGSLAMLLTILEHLYPELGESQCLRKKPLKSSLKKPTKKVTKKATSGVEKPMKKTIKKSSEMLKKASKKVKTI